ncbi:MAG: MBL fold metallo-hydrolase [Vicinamibacterales bacterium]
MKRILTATALALGLALAPLLAQAPLGDIDRHLAAARAAAQQDHLGLFNRLCTPEGATKALIESKGAAPVVPATPRPAATRPPGPPDKSTWATAPAKVFDNLMFVGEKEYSAWAVTTPDGIIIIDTIFEYSVDSQVVGGLRALGYDPSTIKYAIVSHGHRDHSGGAQYLQDSFKTRILLSAADWEMLANNRDPAKPKKDMVVTDGQTLSLGGETLTMYLTPGHTPGTISTLVPVTDHGVKHVAAYWGGTAFNFQPSKERFQMYIDSARRFSDIVARSGADVLISNHTIFDGSKTKLPALAMRKAGDPNPYVIGTDSVRRYLKVAEECAQAVMLRLP